MIQPAAQRNRGALPYLSAQQAALRRSQSLGPEGQLARGALHRGAARLRRFGSKACAGDQQRGESTHCVTPPSRRCHPTQKPSTESGQLQK